MRAVLVFVSCLLFSSTVLANQLPISHENKAKAVQTGVVSGQAEACGLDWNPHFHAFMQFLRAQGVPEEEMTFVAVYHGAAQEKAFSDLDGKCEAKMKHSIEKMVKANMKRFGQ